MSRRKPQTISWNIRQINTMITKGSIKFDHPLQRPADQWEDADKSLLVDSLLTLYCPDVFAIKEKTENGNTYSIIDGLQRLSTIHDLLSDKLTMTDLEDFCLESTGNEVYNISGKKFSQFPEEVQNEITGYTLGLKVFEIEEGDDEEAIIEEIFYRLNNGKPMSKEHKALTKASHKVQKFVHRIATEHKLFNGIAKYSDKATKKSDKQMTIMQAILLISRFDYPSLAAKDIEQVFTKNEITDQVLALTEKSFDLIAIAFPETHKFVTKINIVSMAYLFANSLNHDETIVNLHKYVNEKQVPADGYKNYTGAGNVKKDKTVNRLKGILKICGVEDIGLPVEEVNEQEINVENQEEIQMKLDLDIQPEQEQQELSNDDQWEQPQRIIPESEESNETENTESGITPTSEEFSNSSEETQGEEQVKLSQEVQEGVNEILDIINSSNNINVA